MNKPYVTKAEMRELRAAGFRRTRFVDPETGTRYRQWRRDGFDIVIFVRSDGCAATLSGDGASIDLRGRLGEILVAIPRAREALRFLVDTMAEAPLAVKRAQPQAALGVRGRPL